MPSKGLRDAFIDALNIWFDVPDEAVSRIKWIVSHLHNASLMCVSLDLTIITKHMS